MRSRAFRGLAPSTQADRRRIVGRILDRAERAAVAAIQPRHIEADLAPLTAAVARNRLEVWRALMALAGAEGWRADDPSAPVRAPKGRERPHQAWSREDVAALRARWPLGSQQRTAFALLYWTGAGGRTW